MSYSAPDAATVRERRVGSALVLTLSRPEAGNSIDLDTARALRRALDACRGDRGVRSIVITGDGSRFFCTGGDVKRYRALQDVAELARVFGTVRDLLDQIEALDQPVIAAINGYAVGGGVELALACDIRIAQASARLALPQAKLGIIPGWDGIERLVDTVGRSAAMMILLSGRQYPAAEALAIGLVDEVAQEGTTALDAALACAAEFDSAAPMSIGATKRTVLHCLRSPRTTARAFAADTFGELWFSADHREAEAAFIEKRAPRFGGPDA